MTDYGLIQGDCLSVLPTLEAGSVDAILTDLPYGTTACAWDNVIPFEPMWAQVRRVLKPRGVFVTTASQPFTSKLVCSNLEWFRYEWIWEKTMAANFMNMKLHPRKLHENIIVFSEEVPTYNPQMEAGRPYLDKRRGRLADIFLKTDSMTNKNLIDNNGIRYPSSVQIFENPNFGNNHPTQKPVALYAYLARTYTDAGETILDFCMGSGTTGVAAMQTGRNFIGIELDPGYFAIAQKRIAQAAAQPLLIQDAPKKEVAIQQTIGLEAA